VTPFGIGLVDNVTDKWVNYQFNDPQHHDGNRNERNHVGCLATTVAVEQVAGNKHHKVSRQHPIEHIVPESTK
jgi:hypothetical protein